jgi:hypothetical protein
MDHVTRTPANTTQQIPTTIPSYIAPPTPSLTHRPSHTAQ